MLNNLRKKSLNISFPFKNKNIVLSNGCVVYDASLVCLHSQRCRVSPPTSSFPLSVLDFKYGGVLKTENKVCNTQNGKAIHSEFTMIFCPKGTYSIGKASKDPKKNTYKQETIDSSFLLAETEVTQELYAAVTGQRPSTFSKGKPGPTGLRLIKYQYASDSSPVERVSWFDAIFFCNELSNLQGLDACYTITDKEYEVYYSIENNVKKEWRELRKANVTCNFSKNGYRLPLAKEWEYAAKANTDNVWAGANCVDDLKRHGWYNGNTGKHTQTRPVKKLKPNEWGFYDMSGNVEEWCWDTAVEYGKPSAICKGGCYIDAKEDLKITYASTNYLYTVSDTIGFRIARNLTQKDTIKTC